MAPLKAPKLVAQITDYSRSLERAHRTVLPWILGFSAVVLLADPPFSFPFLSLYFNNPSIKYIVREIEPRENRNWGDSVTLLFSAWWPWWRLESRKRRINSNGIR